MIGDTKVGAQKASSSTDAILANYFSNVAELVLQKASRIKLLICDVDGVLSDGKVYFSNENTELKNFNIKDGFGIKLLQQAGIAVGIITGRESKIVEIRGKELGIALISQGQKNKMTAFKQMLEANNLTPDQVAHIGDDLPDLPIMQMAGLGVTVADGHFFLLEQADWVSRYPGGHGAVRELADLLLFSQGKLGKLLEDFIRV